MVCTASKTECMCKSFWALLIRIRAKFFSAYVVQKKSETTVVEATAGQMIVKEAVVMDGRFKT